MKKRLSAMLLATVFLLSGCGIDTVLESPTNKPEATAFATPDIVIIDVLTQTPKATPTPTSTPILAPEPSRGSYESIPADVREKMAGISMPKGAKSTYNDLSYLTVYYYNFDYERTEGHIVVAKELADEVLDIFAELYEIKYPVESVNLIDEYDSKQTKELNSLDRASMGNNNTSSFCYRTVNGSKNLSQHAYGRAIDLNPKINPYIYGGVLSPVNAKKYADRSDDGLSDIEKAAMIHKGDDVYSIFISYGWEWGGDWKNEKDYQHFQKKK